jgi:hypothetical protein
MLGLLKAAPGFLGGQGRNNLDGDWIIKILIILDIDYKIFAGEKSLTYLSNPS